MAVQAPAQQLVTGFGVRALVKRGYRVRVAVRRPDLAGFLQPLGTVGQIHAVQANLRYPASVTAAVMGADAVVNLVGIMQENGRQSFTAVQANGARAVAQACATVGISRLVQISALGADAESRSVYARTKAEGEAAVRQIIPQAVILRPSVLFGPEDTFFNRFASMARMMPILPLVGDGQARLQPAFAGDVAEVVARAVDGSIAAGRTYELGGAEVLTLRQLVEDVWQVSKRLIAPLPLPVAGVLARVLGLVDTLTLGLLPNELKLTRDQVQLLGQDNVVSAEAVKDGRDFAGLGIAPVSVEVEVPSYLWRFRRTGQFETARPA